MSLVAAKSGYLDVKTSAKSRGIRMLKAWRKRWVVISSKDIHPPSLIIQVYGNDSSPLKERSCLFSKIIKSENASVYRSRSRTHKHAFSIAEDCNPSLHLGGNSETQSQEWMACMRDLLWPPNPIEQINTVLNGRYEVSLIDNEFSCKAGMLGLYGNLAVTRNKLSITAPQTGCLIKEWHLNNINRYQLVPQMCKEDSSKVFSIIVTDTSGLNGHLQFFSIHAISIVETISKAFEQYRLSFESLLDSPISDDHDLILFDDVFRKTEEATTDNELDVRISLNSSGSTATSGSDGPLPLRLLSLPDNMLDCSITSQITPECETRSYSPPSSLYFNYEHLDYDLSAELESLVEDNRRLSSNSITSHIYANISSYPSSRRQSQTESIYEEIENYQHSDEEGHCPPLPPRNNPPVCKEPSLEEYKCISPTRQYEDYAISRKMFERMVKNKQDIFLNENRPLNRTISTPTFYVPLDKHYSQEIGQTISRSAPNAPLCFPFSADYTDCKSKSVASSHPSENQLLSQSLKFRQRSRTCPGSNNELELLVTELNNSEPKHRKFRQCLKTLSESNLLVSDFSFSNASCAELFSEFKRFSSDYCKMNSLQLDTSEKQEQESEYYDSDYMDMNGTF